MFVASGNEDDEDGAYDWPSGIGNQVSSFEESLLCPICQGLFQNPQMLKCGHSFCSICIRKSLDKVLNAHRTTTYMQCPSCREKADSADLIPNRALAVVITNYKTMRKDLFSFLSQTTNMGKPNKAASSSSSSSAPHTTHGNPVIRRMPHYNFHGMTREKIRKTIENHTKESKVKLRLDGDKEVLERRFRELVHLNNAQVDSIQPLTFEEVVREVNARESARELEAKKSSSTLGKLEKLKNGEEVKGLSDKFNELAQLALVQKHKHLSEMTSRAENSGIDPVAQDNVTRKFIAPRELSLPGYDWGPWRVVMSNKLGKPFFYNTVTKIGQFAIPTELKMIPFDDDDDGAEGDGDEEGDVVDVDDDDEREVDHTISGPLRSSGIAAGTQHPHTQSSLPPATQAEQFNYDVSQASSRGKGKRSQPSHSAVSFSSEVSTIVDGSQLSEVHLELLDESSDRKKSRKSCDDDNAGIALRKTYQTFRDEDDDDGETSGGVVVVGDPFQATQSEFALTGVVDRSQSNSNPPDTQGWSCEACTFINNSTATTCEICAAVNPTMKLKTRSKSSQAGYSAGGSGSSSVNSTSNRSISPVVSTDGRAPRGFSMTSSSIVEQVRLPPAAAAATPDATSSGRRDRQRQSLIASDSIFSPPPLPPRTSGRSSRKRK